MWIEAADGRLVNSDFVTSIKKGNSVLFASISHEAGDVRLTDRLEDEELDTALSQLRYDLNKEGGKRMTFELRGHGEERDIR